MAIELTVQGEDIDLSITEETLSLDVQPSAHALTVQDGAPIDVEVLAGPFSLDIIDDPVIVTLEVTKEEQVPEFETRLDAVGGDPAVTYIGEAQPGSVTSAAVWRIKKMEEFTDGDIVIEWADGNANFDNVWDDRATLSYS